MSTVEAFDAFVQRLSQGNQVRFGKEQTNGVAVIRAHVESILKESAGKDTTIHEREVTIQQRTQERDDLQQVIDAILLISPGQLDQLADRIGAMDAVELQQIAAIQAVQDADGDTTLEKVQTIIDQAAQLAQRTQERDDLQQVIDAILLISPGQLDQLADRIQAMSPIELQQIAAIQAVQDADGDTTLEKVQTIIDQAAQLLQRTQERNALQQVIDAILVHSPGQLDQLAARIGAMDAVELQQIAAIQAVQDAPGGTTLQKVQGLIAKALQTDALQLRADILDQVVALGRGINDGNVVGWVQGNQLLINEIVHLIFTADELRGAIGPADIRNRVQLLKDRDVIHVRAEAQLHGVHGNDLAERVINRNQEHADVQSLTGTVKRIFTGIWNGFVNVLSFFFISIPTYILDTLRYIGGIVAR